jgi:hypothetical protein
MDKIEKYKKQASRRLISVVLTGIMTFGLIIWSIKIGHIELVVLPFLALLLIHYTDYTSLKTKIELLEEFNKKINE